VKPPACLRPPGWLRLPTVLLVMAAVTTWAVPGSATVSSARAQHLTLLMAAPASTAAASTSCDPTASLRPTGPPQVTAGSFMAKIRARGFLIAGVDQNTYHFGYLNPLDGKIEGFDIDMVHAVAAAIFGNPDKVEFKAISDAQRMPDVQSAAVDIVVHTMTINCARLQQVDFSTVYFDAGQRVLVRSDSPVKSLSDLGRQKVCATTGSTSLANIRAAYPVGGPIAVAVPYWTDCLVLLQQGDVAAISTDDSILAGLAAQDPWTKIVGPRFSSEPYGLAISQQHPDFVRFVNAVLQQLRTNGHWAASFARWVGTPVPAPPPAHYKG
jgi:polar amino acid transport system substrate-binding protein